MSIMYILSRGMCRFVIPFYFKVTVRARQNVIPLGSCVIAVNHTSLWDPPLVGSFLKRPAFFLAKESLFKGILGYWFFHAIQVIPVNRENPSHNTIRKLVSLLNQGKLVVLFPEGTRRIDGQPSEYKEGVGLIASYARVPIIPCCIEHMRTEKSFWKRTPVTISYGEPLYYTDYYDETKTKKENYTMISQRVMQAIAALRSDHREQLCSESISKV